MSHKIVRHALGINSMGVTYAVPSMSHNLVRHVRVVPRMSHKNMRHSVGSMCSRKNHNCETRCTKYASQYCETCPRSTEYVSRNMLYLI